jgi:hypothetical protein
MLEKQLQNMPRGHPLRAQFGELAKLYEEVAATRAELAIASSRLGKLSPKHAPRVPSPSRPATSPAAARPRSARRPAQPPSRERIGTGGTPLSDQAASRWSEYVKQFERKQEEALAAAQRAAAEAAAQSEDEGGS